MASPSTAAATTQRCNQSMLTTRAGRKSASMRSGVVTRGHGGGVLGNDFDDLGKKWTHESQLARSNSFARETSEGSAYDLSVK